MLIVFGVYTFECGEIMDIERVGSIVSFVFLDGLLIFAVFMLLQLDWLVNHTLYSYNLTFSVDWAVPYWTFLRATLVLLSLAIVVIAFLAYGSYRRVKRLGELTVYVCESCGSAWAKAWDRFGSMEKVRSTKLKVLKSCPNCNKKLLGE